MHFTHLFTKFVSNIFVFKTECNNEFQYDIQYNIFLIFALIEHLIITLIKDK